MATPTIAACFIVRNGAATLGRAIDSIRPHVDEICIYDTGSTDGTLDLLRSLAAEPGSPIRVEHGEWRDDYAWARNQSFAMASSDYLAWFDDDEILEGGEHLRRILEVLNPDALYVRRVEIWRHVDALCHSRVRLVRAAAGLRWESAIHERLDDYELGDGIDRRVARPDRVRVIHHPLQQEGRHRHRRLVEQLALAGDRWLMYYVGRYRLADGPDPRPAAEAFQAVVDAPQPRQTWELGYIVDSLVELALCRHELGDRKGAVEALQSAADLRAEMGRDPFRRLCAALELAHPIQPDDPIWDLADDDRTADAYEPETVTAVASLALAERSSQQRGVCRGGPACSSRPAPSQARAPYGITFSVSG